MSQLEDLQHLEAIQNQKMTPDEIEALAKLYLAEDPNSRKAHELLAIAEERRS